MTDFLLELRSEEIPARMQARARADLERLFAAELARDGLQAAAIETYATPRRLALIARGLPPSTQPVSEEIKGPRASAPPQALDGFLRKTGLSRERLVERDGVFYAVLDKPGRATAELLAQAIPAIVRAFPWPKSMRWGETSFSTESPRWVRPLQGIVAILGETLVECEVAGIASGCATVGHRFHAPGPITIGGAQDYVEKLRACHVIVDQDERAALIRDRAAALAAEAGLALIEDEGLVAENAGLTEWPVPLLGRFDAAFLDVPAEVIQLTARVNQKYFVCRDASGALANAFVCVANIAASDGGARIVEGNQKVLAARLSDARFFYDTDLKVPLEAQAEKLCKIVFHEKLGTVADKVDRVAKLARWLVEEGIVKSPSRLREGLGEGVSASDAPGLTGPPPTPPASGRGEEALAILAERAARLCKADLVTGMVGEFPELQGIMGGYYARAQGEPREVWEAVRDHYKPVGQGDEVPTAPVTVAVSLADKLDTILAFQTIGLTPTGSRDPFAIRRATLACLSLLVSNSSRVSLSQIFAAWLGVATRQAVGDLRKSTANNDKITRRNDQLKSLFQVIAAGGFEDVRLEAVAALRVLITNAEGVRFEAWGNAFSELEKDKYRTFLASLLGNFLDRLKVQQREAGVRHDLIDAVFALGGEDDLVRLLVRVHALQAFVQTPEGTDLLAGYKRAANILKKEGGALPITVTPAKAGVSGDGAGQETREAPASAGATGREATADALAAAAAASTPFGEETGRPPHERAVLAADREGGHVSQTAEEDPLVEVDTDRAGFAPVVADFARSERGNRSPHTPEPAEAALAAALDAAEPRAAAAIATEDFTEAMAALATLRAPIDAFFESVTVNDPDPAKREARLALLARMRDAVHTVADFSRIDG